LDDISRKTKVRKGQIKFFLLCPKKMKENSAKMNIFKAFDSNYIAKFGLTSRECTCFAGVDFAS